uniref:Copper transport protein n=1 Tax=Strigamia maritima TaxID=126957 RepID=T1J7K8_STRMM
MTLARHCRDSFVAVCLVVALVSSFLQWIKQLESQFQGHLIHSNFSTNVSSIRFFHWSKFIWLTICTVLYVVQIVLDYFLMLSVMTYNFYLLLAVIIGSAIDSVSSEIGSPSSEESRKIYTMTLEFNHEIAIFQSALKCVIQKYTCIKSLEYNHRRSALEIIRRAYEDILKIREDDNLSVLQKHHLDRKLAFGLMCSIYKEKVEYWQPGECFEQFRDIYPPTSWPFILEIIKSFQWNDYLIECLDSTHPESLIAILNDILMHILNPDDENIPILFRILTILIQKMFSFHCNAFTNKRILNIEDQINTVSSFLAQQIAISSQWQPVTLNKYYVHLFDCIFDTCDALLNTDTEKETTTTSEIITMKNLAQYDMEKTCVKQLLTDTSFDNLQWLIKFYQLCYDSLLMLDLNEMKQFALISGGKLSEKKRLAFGFEGLFERFECKVDCVRCKSI